jgi:hypothetical protein
MTVQSSADAINNSPAVAQAPAPKPTVTVNAPTTPPRTTASENEIAIFDSVPALLATALDLTSRVGSYRLARKDVAPLQAHAKRIWGARSGEDRRGRFEFKNRRPKRQLVFEDGYLSSNAVRAGLVRKTEERGVWAVTPEGREFVAAGPEAEMVRNVDTGADETAPSNTVKGATFERYCEPLLHAMFPAFTWLNQGRYK